LFWNGLRPNLGVKDPTMHTSLIGDEASQLFTRWPNITKQSKNQFNILNLILKK